MLEYKEIILIGYSGHAYVVAETSLALGYNLVGYLDKSAKEKNPFQLNYLGTENEWHGRSILFPAVGDNKLRKRMIELVEKRGLTLCSLVDPSASISKFAQIETGTYVAPHARINALAQIGKGCIINTNATIEHECVIGNYTHIAPGAVLAGNVIVGENTFIGANSVIKQGVVIGNHVVIGAGSVVIKNIQDGETWVGNPAKKLR